MRHLQLQNDAVEQYSRHSSMRISGIMEDQEDPTQELVNLASKVLEADPPLQPQDIDVSHRLVSTEHPRGRASSNHSEIYDWNWPQQDSSQ